MIECFKRSAYT